MNRILQLAHHTWAQKDADRARRLRYKRYTYGDQWGDLMPDGNGGMVPEKTLVKFSGREPLTHNLIRRLIKTVIGRYRTICDERNRYSDLPDSLDRLNALAELDSRLLEEFLISGCAIQRVVAETRHGRHGVWIDNVCPTRFFVNDFRDPRGWDVNIVGMLHDMSPGEMMSRFGSRFNIAKARGVSGPLLDSDETFFNARNGMFRAIEVWTYQPRLTNFAHDTDSAAVGTIEPGQQSTGNINIARRMDFSWHCRWFDGAGNLLDHYTSPFPHGQHPFVFKFYPLVDGEVHSFVEDIIDQQRCVNRLMVLMDKMLGASAKGVLLFPMTQLHKDFPIDRVMESWSAADGIIPINGTSPILPQQVSGSGNDVGAQRLLELEMKFFEDISGVSEALMGKSSGSTGGAGLFNAQVQSSTSALADIFETFMDLTRARDDKALRS